MPEDPKQKNPIETILDLPEEKQKDLFSRLPMEVKQGLFSQMANGFTQGQRYRFQRAAGLLPQAQAPRTAAESLGEYAGELGKKAQEYQYKATPNLDTKGGKDRGLLERGLNDAISGLYAGGQAGAEIMSAFADPKTAYAALASKIFPPAGAVYFAYQSSGPAAEAINKIKQGDLSPETVHQALMSLSGLVGSGAMGGERTATPAEVKASFNAKVRPIARNVVGIEPALRKEVMAEADKFKTADAANREKLAETIKENQDKLAASRFREGEQKFSLQKTNKEIEAENLRKTQETEAAKKTRQENLVKVEEQSRQAKAKIEDVENKVWQEANRKFDAVKEKIGADREGEPTESPQPLIEAVNVAQNNVLRGIPESTALFRSILKLEGEEAPALAELRQQVMQGQGMSGSYDALRPEQKGLADDIAKRYGGEITEGQAVTWGKLQRIKTAAETALRSRSTPAIVKEALSGVQEATVGLMGKMAESKGATAEWQEANRFWREWREDFHQRTGPAGSASPIAETMEAVDPKYIREKLARTYNEGSGENRAVQILQKYGQYGGTEAASLVQQTVETHRSIGKVPRDPILKSPKPVPDVSTAKPDLKPLPQKVPQPVVDVQQVTRKAIEDRARNWGSFNARDVGIVASSVVLAPIIKFAFGKYGEGASSLYGTAAMSYEGGKYFAMKTLRNPKVVDWLSKTPPEEMAALQKIPGADKVKIIDGITESAVQTLSQMDFSTDNTAFERAKQELGQDAKLSDVSKRAAQLNSEEIARRQKLYDAAQGAKPVYISNEARALLGPANVARILAAAGKRKEATKPVQNRKEAIDRLRPPTP